MTRPTTQSLLATLAAFRTISRDPNEDMIRFIAATLAEAGAQIRVLPGLAPGKFNLLARLGPPHGQGLVLSGHADVVPTEGQPWSSDPFTLTARGDKLLARGACDMKGFLAATLSLAARLRHRRPLTRPLHIAISHDEETGCLGVRPMLATMAAENFTAQGCIIGEPTGMRVATGHKGKIAGRISCRGQAAHAASPARGVNAIYLAAGMVHELKTLQSWLETTGARDQNYSVPHTTLHIGTIAGGTASNIVPDCCEMTFECRHLPAASPNDILSRLRAAAAALSKTEGAAITIEETNRYPGLETDQNAPLVGLACAATGSCATSALSFGTEAGLFEEMLGLPCIVCGPGDIDRAHKADEYITGTELAACDRFLDRLATSLE